MFEAQIAKGVEYLDQDLGPSWVERIRVDRLELNDCFRCVIGQLYGSFYERFEEPAEASNLGFSINTEKPAIWYITLNREWKEKIAQLRAERTN